MDLPAPAAGWRVHKIVKLGFGRLGIDINKSRPAQDRFRWFWTAFAHERWVITLAPGGQISGLRGSQYWSELLFDFGFNRHGPGLQILPFRSGLVTRSGHELAQFRHQSLAFLHGGEIDRPHGVPLRCWQV